MLVIRDELSYQSEHKFNHFFHFYHIWQLPLSMVVKEAGMSAPTIIRNQWHQLALSLIICLLEFPSHVNKVAGIALTLLNKYGQNTLFWQWHVWLMTSWDTHHHFVYITVDSWRSYPTCWPVGFFVLSSHQAFFIVYNKDLNCWSMWLIVDLHCGAFFLN